MEEEDEDAARLAEEFEVLDRERLALEEAEKAAAADEEGF